MPHAVVIIYPELQHGLVLGWSPHLGATGTTVFDKSLFHADGVLVDGDHWTQFEQYNSVRSEAGVLLVSNVTLLSPIVSGTSFTVSFWVYKTATGYQFIFQGEDASAPSFEDETFWMNNSESVVSSITLNTWTHFACRYDANGGKMGVWKDGVPSGTHLTSVSGDRITTLNLLRLASNFYWLGGLAELLVHNRALTESEMATLAVKPGQIHATRRIRRSKISAAGSADTGSGSASLNFTASAGGSSDRVCSGSASLSITAAAGGAADGIGSGSASVSLTAAAGGAVDFIGSGSASLSIAAAAGGAADGIGSGSASLNFTAAGGAFIEGTGSGSASLSMTASAGGLSDRAGSGSASLSFAAAAGSVTSTKVSWWAWSQFGMTS